MKAWRHLAIPVLFVLAACAQTGVHVRPPSPDRPPVAGAVLIEPPDVELYSLTAGGVLEAQQEWTASAVDYVYEALTDELRSRGLSPSRYSAPVDPMRQRVHEQLFKLQALVGGAILTHQYNQAFQLPTKAGRLDWTLGQDANALCADCGTDYAVFVFLRDSYSTGGRVAFAIGAALLGVAVPGGRQVGFASLVDLRTGDFLWFNRIISSAGDLRTPDAAHQAVATLFQGFPK